MLQKLEMNARDIILTAIEAGAAALVTALLTGGSISKATLSAAGVIALRAGLGAIANLKAAKP